MKAWSAFLSGPSKIYCARISWAWKRRSLAMTLKSGSGKDSRNRGARALLPHRQISVAPTFRLAFFQPGRCLPEGGRYTSQRNSTIFKGTFNRRLPIFGPWSGCLYNIRMPNRAYASVWVRDFNEENMLSHLELFLATVPLASTPPGFTGL